MTKTSLRVLLLAAAFLPGRAALAEAPPEVARAFCADRPGLGTPPCTLAPGSAMMELGVAGWERSRDAGALEDEITLGEAVMRVGLGPSTEVQFGVTGHVIQRRKNFTTGTIDRVSGIGDGTIAIRQGLAGANGPVALQVFATMPLARRPIGTGEWSGGVLLPVSLDLPSGFQLALTPEVDWAANESGVGRHIAYGGVVGVSRALGKAVTLSGEVGAFRDEDPGGRRTDARLAGSLAWQVSDRFQIDFEADAGISAGAPDRALLVGVAWRFR